MVPDRVVGIFGLLFVDKLRCSRKNCVNGSDLSDAKLTLKSPLIIIGSLFSPLPINALPLVE